MIMNKIRKKMSCGFWNIGFITSSAESLINGKKDYIIKWMKHNNKNCFYADPFPISEDEKFYYLLAEEYNYFLSKGVIVKLKVDKRTFEMKEREIYIETKYHLSFPFPYKDFVVPEQYRSGKLFAYTDDGLEHCISDYPVIDPVLFEYKGHEYLFGTLPCNDNLGQNRSLFWFEKKEDKYILKHKKAIKEDIKSARPAGKFFEVGGCLYRGAQDCEKSYGYQTRLMKVSINEDDYKEEEVAIINSFKENKFNMGLHTFNPLNDIVIVDGFQFEYRFFQKWLYLINRYSSKYLNINLIKTNI